MGRALLSLATVSIYALSAIALAQGGMQGTYQGNSIQRVENAMASYLNGDEARSILSPGEFCEWDLKLKAGQVVIAEASSDAFDPALEMLDEKGKVLASNDDRYPGDQRPLLLWRCPADGSYPLHVRCFHDKSGGQFTLRYNVYDSLDMSSCEKVERSTESDSPFLLRVPMKAGEVKEILSDINGEPNRSGIRFIQAISSSGLPDINLAQPISSISRNAILVAPVSGDYYVLEAPDYNRSRGSLHIRARTIVPEKLEPQGGVLSGNSLTNTASLWQIQVKAGQLLEADTPGVRVETTLLIADQPDISKYDVSKPETNPFFPASVHASGDQGPGFQMLTGRARDRRIAVFYARRDTTLWIATNGSDGANREFNLQVKPAAASFPEDAASTGKLKIGNTDYWAFDAKAGDVMTLKSEAVNFSQQVLVRDPELYEIRSFVAGTDQTSDEWRMIVQKPGKYLVSMACMGDGGGGDYTLSRKVFHAQEFGINAPAKSEISDGQVQIWKFTATPSKPLLIHWNSSNWDYDVAVYDDKGSQTDFERQEIDGHNRFGILKVNKPQTFVIVLTGHGQKANYSIDLGDIPGYVAAK